MLERKVKQHFEIIDSPCRETMHPNCRVLFNKDINDLTANVKIVQDK